MKRFLLATLVVFFAIGGLRANAQEQPIPPLPNLDDYVLEAVRQIGECPAVVAAAYERKDGSSRPWRHFPLVTYVKSGDAKSRVPFLWVLFDEKDLIGVWVDFNRDGKADKYYATMEDARRADVANVCVIVQQVPSP